MDCEFILSFFFYFFIRFFIHSFDTFRYCRYILETSVLQYFYSDPAKSAQDISILHLETYDSIFSGTFFFFFFFFFFFLFIFPFFISY